MEVLPSQWEAVQPAAYLDFESMEPSRGQIQERIDLFHGQTLHVGRNTGPDLSSDQPAHFYLSIDSILVSDFHFRIYPLVFEYLETEEPRPLFYCEDMQSCNGTWAGDGTHCIGIRGSATSIHLLQNEDVISIKPYWTFRYVATPQDNPLDSLQDKETALFRDSFQLTHTSLGIGASGKVILATQNSRQLACKIVDFRAVWRSYLSGNQMKYRVSKDIHALKAAFLVHRSRSINEYQLLLRLRHPNIVVLIKAFESPHNIYTFTELATGGDLFSYLDCMGVLSEVEALVISRQVGKAICYIHGQGIVHRDIKIENILLTRSDVGHRVVLSDFGHARTISADDQVMTSQAGTIGYVAPELRNHELGYTRAVDLFSFGIVIGCLLAGEVFSNHDERQSQSQEQLAARERRIFVYCEEQPATLVNMLIARNPKDRPSASDVLRHVWFCNTPQLVTELDACEQRATRHWKPWQEDRGLVEQLPDLLPPVNPEANVGVEKLLPYLSDATTSRHFEQHRVEGGDFKTDEPWQHHSDNVPPCEAMSLSQRLVVEVKGYDLFSHKEESVRELETYRWASCMSEDFAEAEGNVSRGIT